MVISKSQLHYEFATFRGLLADPSFWKLSVKAHKHILRTLDKCWLEADLSEHGLITAALEYQELLTEYVSIAQLPTLKGPIS